MNDTYASYLSAAVASRDKTALVVSAADAGPALECLGDPTLVFRYGLFTFAKSGCSSSAGLVVGQNEPNWINPWR